jgi:AhpD family alkylhydroperoxidase
LRDNRDVPSMREVEWEACLLEPRRDPDLERRVRRRFGRVGGALAYFSACPWLSENLAALNAQLRTTVRLDHQLTDMAGVVVSHDNACRYCYAATRAYLRLLGYSEERIRALEQELLTAEFRPAERAALDYARRVSRANPLPTLADAEPLRAAGFDNLAIKELAGFVALTVFYNRLSTLAALPPHHLESLPDRWYMRLFRPILTPFVERFRRHAADTRLRDDQRCGPFAPVVCALDGLPLAGELRAFLDVLWASNVLPVRAKALVFGVVAKGLGCAASEREATRLAVEAGMPRADVAHALAHLTSPALAPIEAIALPFARETIWYQPAAIQRRSRAVRDALPRTEYVELLVTAAAANMVCRLCPAVVDNR